MEIFTAIGVSAAVAIGILNLVKTTSLGKKDDEQKLLKQLELTNQRLELLRTEMLDSQSRTRSELLGGTTNSIARLGDSLRDEQVKQRKATEERLTQIERELEKIRTSTLETLEKVQTSTLTTLEKIREENKQSLDNINGTVNEKLQKTLDDKISRSFEAVNKRLAEVYEGLGEMKNVASGVSDLKNVLSNVKTRGIMGEIQLGAILSEILAPEQYEEQAAVTPHSRERVDFAVRLPGSEEGKCVYLPIDSKFPGDSYANLLEACESGNAEEIRKRRAALEAELKAEAKSISAKYISPPHTTDFAIMFLPSEGLYAEAVNRGMVEQLQSAYKVNIAGPSTMAAMLNSLQMGFRTLAIQKKSGEVWKVLEEAKKEFSTFSTVLDKTRSRLRQADEELDKLIGTRTRAINRRLRDIELPDGTADAVSAIEQNTQQEELL